MKLSTQVDHAYIRTGYFDPESIFVYSLGIDSDYRAGDISLFEYINQVSMAKRISMAFLTRVDHYLVLIKHTRENSDGIFNTDLDGMFNMGTQLPNLVNRMLFNPAVRAFLG